MQPTKAQKTSKDTTIRSMEQATKEPSPLRQKINAVTLPNGKSITPYTNDDTSEDQPIIFDNEGYDETQLLEEMKHESNQMKLHDVYDEVDASTVDDNVMREAIPTRWVHRKTERKDQEYEAESSQKATRRRSRTKTPSTPLHPCSRHSGHFSSRPNWIARLGDVSTAFLHAPIAKDHDGKQRDVYLWPPKELCPQQDKIWQLKKAMYGLRSLPKAWQDYLAEVLQKLSFVRLKSEPNVYTNATRDCYIMVYVDDLLVLGDKTAVDSTFEAVQKQVLLKHIGYLEPGKQQEFLGRNIDHFGNYCNLGLKDSYIDNMIE